MKCLTLRTKLIAAFLVMAALPLIIGLYTNIQIKGLSEDADVDQNLTRIKVELLNARRHEKNFFLRKDTQYVQKVRDQVALITEIEQKKIAMEDLTPGQQALMKEAIAMTGEYLNAFLRQVDVFKDADNASALDEKEKDVIDAARKIETNINTISTEIHNGIIKSYKSIQWVNYAMTFISIVVGITFGVVISVLLSRKIAAVAKSLDSASGEASEASHEVASSSQSLAQGASEQAASLEETSASMEEITSIIKSNADNARAVKGLTTETHTITQEQTSGMRVLQQRLSDLEHSSQEMTGAIKEIKGSSDAISKIIKTIDEIAFQTNILALNAAVEAARAGESGMGFAVVADEVRNLAKRSADAAKETSALIENAIGKSEAGVRVNESITTALGEVERHAVEVQNGLEGISSKVASVDTAMTQIVSASEEQSRGVGEINKAISEMDKVTQSNASCAEESASAAQQLSAQAQELKGLAGRLAEIVNGAGTVPVASKSSVVRAPSALKRPALAPAPVRRASVPGARPTSRSSSQEPEMDFKDL